MDDLFRIGQITSAHGIRGDLKVFPVTSDPDRFLDHAENIILHENEVFTHEIDVFDPNWPKGHGLMLADSFVITKDGAKVFADIPVEVASIKC